MEPWGFNPSCPAQGRCSKGRRTVGVELDVEHGFSKASTTLHNMASTVGNLNPTNEVIALRGCTGINGEAVFAHQGGQVLWQFKLGLLDLISIHNAVCVVVVNPRLPKIDIGVRWEVRAVGDGEHDGRSGCDVSTVKALN